MLQSSIWRLSTRRAGGGTILTPPQTKLTEPKAAPDVAEEVLKVKSCMASAGGLPAAVWPAMACSPRSLNVGRIRAAECAYALV